MLFFTSTYSVPSHIWLHLDSKERGEQNVGEDDEVHLVEEASEHEDDQDEVHDGKHAQGHSLNMGSVKSIGVLKWALKIRNNPISNF